MTYILTVVKNMTNLCVMYIIMVKRAVNFEISTTEKTSCKRNNIPQYVDDDALYQISPCIHKYSTLYTRAGKYICLGGWFTTVVTPVLLRYDLITSNVFESGFVNQGTKHVESSTCRLVVKLFRRQPIAKLWFVVGPLTITRIRFVVGNMYVDISISAFRIKMYTKHHTF